MSDDMTLRVPLSALGPYGCPVVGELFGFYKVGACGDPITHEVTFTCEGGCVREPRRVCEYHALLLSKDDESAWCGKCQLHRIHPAGVRVLGEHQGGGE